MDLACIRRFDQPRWRSFTTKKSCVHQPAAPGSQESESDPGQKAEKYTRTERTGDVVTIESRHAVSDVNFVMILFCGYVCC